MHKFRIAFICLLISMQASAQDHPLWMRYPAISPDGQTILFSYKGDIYKVPASGGTAVPLTIGPSIEYAPVWSHDGKQIAFASDRYGNFDVFVMPAAGGEARRLTYFSGPEIPSSFSADDKSIYFSANRQDLVTNAQFPISLMTELYSVPANGGRIQMVIPVPAINATVNSSGNKIIYHDLKGYESDWRKHHTSAIARDIWTYDMKSGKYDKLTTFAGEDRNPVFDSNDKDYYYLSERNGSFNIFKSGIADSTSVALTHFSKNPVRFLSRAADNTLCFGYDGEIYTKKPAAEPVRVDIRIAEDGRYVIDRILPINGGATEMKLSPNGKEVAYIVRGEIFVTSVTGGVTKRITNTPWQERSVSFSPDGRSLLFAAEKDNSWNVYSLSIIRKEEPYFYVSTVLKEETVIATPAEEYQPAYSPDGKEVAYLENRQTLKVINLASRKSRMVMPADKNYSYADGDQYYQWSPDSKWFLVSYGPPERVQTPEVGLVSANGGEITNLTLSGYDDMTPKWSMDGKAMIWGTDRNGTRQQAGYPATADVFALYFTKEGFDRAQLTKEQFELLKEQEKKKTEDEKKGPDAKDKNKKDAPKKDDSAKKVVIDWDHLPDRKLKLTTHTSDAIDWLMSKDGEKIYYLTSFEKGYDIWVTELRTKETRLFAKLGGHMVSMDLSDDGKFLVALSDGRIQKIDAESGKMEPVAVAGEMSLKDGDEKSYIFEHIWRQLKEKFILVDLGGVDWDYYHGVYKKFIPFINNDFDFSEMLSEMLGELNASHTGCYYRPVLAPTVDRTADLGLLYDYQYAGSGLRVAELVSGGPLDKANTKIHAGVILEKIDGEPITDSLDFYSMLNRKADKLILLSFYDPSTKARWEETTQPISGGEANELLYKRWVERRRQETDSLSKGKIGYIHVRAMDDASMRTVFEEALGRNIGKQAIIVDTRFNGGGNIHEPLSDFLNGKKSFDIVPHGQYIGYEPQDKWIKPSIVLIGESNYSDAHLFPELYKLKNVGKTLGMPIPGTGTFVWWEMQIDPALRFGIPMGGWRAPGENFFQENHQMEPDIKVTNAPDILTNGRDQQIEAAVQELLKK